MHDSVNHPAHYTSHPARCRCGSGVECIQITEHMNFCLGNALKYIWRCGLKGDEIEDLEKAVWYLNRELARRREQAREPELEPDRICGVRLTPLLEYPVQRCGKPFGHLDSCSARV